MTAHNLLNTRELDARVTDGVHVRLLWDEHDDSVVVTVVDTRRGDAFSVQVPDGGNPVDVFNHPFAYAPA